MNILGLDPGKLNFAYSVIDTDTFEPSYGMLVHTVKDLTSKTDSQGRDFSHEIRGIIKRFKIDYIVAERYMNRGRTGTTNEVINIMLGLIIAQSPKIPKQLITAAQWKNSFNKIDCLNTVYGESRLVPHVIDATFIALYGSRFFGQNLMNERSINTVLDYLK